MSLTEGSNILFDARLEMWQNQGLWTKHEWLMKCRNRRLWVRGGSKSRVKDSKHVVWHDNIDHWCSLCVLALVGHSIDARLKKRWFRSKGLRHNGIKKGNMWQFVDGCIAFTPKLCIRNMWAKIGTLNTELTQAAAHFSKCSWPRGKCGPSAGMKQWSEWHVDTLHSQRSCNILILSFRATFAGRIAHYFSA